MQIKRKRFIYLSIIVVILIFVIGQHYWLHHHAHHYKWTRVTRGSITQTVTAVGTLEPKQMVTVTSMIPGNVEKIFHDEGDYVQVGTPLLQIKPNPTPANVAEDKRELQQKVVDERLAKQTLARYKTGIANGAISKDQYTKAKQAYKDALVQRQLAQEQLGLLVSGRATVDGESVNSTIVSPISGYILKRYVDVGGNVIAQTQSLAGEVLFTIANMKRMLFKGQVDEIDSGKLKSGMSASVRIAALPNIKIHGQLSLIALQSEEDAEQIAATGKASSVGDDSASAQNNPFNVGFSVQIDHLQLPKKARLRAGYSATASITVKTLKHVLLIPESAIVPGEKDYAYVYVYKANQSKPVKRKITIGIADGMHVQVLKGLTLGEKLLLTPPSQPTSSQA